MPAKPSPPETATLRDRIDILLAEYGALYQLAEFRMASLDRRVPAVGAALIGLLGSFPVLPPQTQLLLLAVVPMSLVWFVRTTINHARSFEDLLRRIEQLEGALNTHASADLVGFQRLHPSRGRAVGGRTGAETVGAVVLASSLLLSSCTFLAWGLSWGADAGWAYFCYLSIIGCVIINDIRLWCRYGSTKYPVEK